MIRINEVSDEALLDIYANSCRHMARARRNLSYEISLEDMQIDNDHIMREIMNRIPSTHKWCVDEIRKGLTEPARDIKAGMQYRHNVIRGLRLQICDEVDYKGPLFSCRAFIGSIYVCRFIIKQHTILQHFERI
jgi:hypothetical protein